MRTGRPPRPDHLRIGSNGKAPGEPISPALQDLYATDPVPPAWLSERARETFFMYVNDRLKPYGLASEVDTELLALLAETTEEYKVLVEDVRINGYSEIGGNGGVKTRPEATQLRAIVGQMKQLLEQFGLTPSARARVPPRKSPNEGGGGDNKSGFGEFH